MREQPTRSLYHLEPLATYLDTVGAPFALIKQLLNHKTKADVTERYIQRRSITEMRKYSEVVVSLIKSAPVQGSALSQSLSLEIGPR